MFKKSTICLTLLCFSIWGGSSFAEDIKNDLTDLSLEDLMNVEVISVSKKRERLFNTAAATYVITQDDIHRSGATTIPELLRNVPGLNVQRVNSHSWDISARGFNGSIFANKLLVLIDGRAVYTPLYGGVIWEVQDTVLEDIERIEVVRGSGGTLWGANAVNGVINIITKKAKDTKGGLITVGGGTEERVFTTARYGSKVKDWDYRTYVKYFNRDEGYRSVGTANDEWQAGRTGFKAEKDQVTVQGDFYQEMLGQRVVQTQFYSPFTEISDHPSYAQGGNLLARYEEVDDYRLQGYWDVTNRNYQTLKERRDTLDLEFNKHADLTNNQQIIWGLGYRLNLENITETDTVAIRATSKLDQVYSFFLQDELKLLEDKLRLTVGSKIEHNIYTGFEYQPNARVSYEINEHNMLWTAVSRSIRTPSRLEEDGEITSIGASRSTRLQGNHDIESEIMKSVEIGYRTQPMANVVLDTTAFADHYDEIITYDVGNTISERGYSIVTYPSVNGLKGDIQGVELSGDVQLREWWKIRSTYTFTKSTLSTHAEIGRNGLEDLLENSFPRQFASLRSFFDLPHQVQLNAALRYTDAFSHNNVPSNTDMDINLSKAIKDWEFSIVGQNLFRKHHREATGSGIGLTQVQRSGYVKVTHKF